ncbi:MAG: hypothetical protein GX638_03405, partial [Crenarchaeota archaeon]|nr:hypothetical protein [Thermoproteota archaeon]
MLEKKQSTIVFNRSSGHVRNWKISFLSFISIVTLLLITIFSNFGGPIQVDGAEDTRARIGFSEERVFVPKVNGDEVTVKVAISAPQNTDTQFSLSEDVADCEDTLFQFAQSYTLPAGVEFVEITFNQVQSIQTTNGVLWREIFLSCDTETVVAGDRWNLGETEPY